MQFNFPNPPERNPMSQWRKHWACYLCSAGCFRFLINKCYLYSTCCFTFFISKCRVKSWNSQIKLREAPILQRPLTGNISKVTSAKCNIWRFLCQSLEQSNFFTLKYKNNNLQITVCMEYKLQMCWNQCIYGQFLVIDNRISVVWTITVWYQPYYILGVQIKNNNTETSMQKKKRKI